MPRKRIYTILLLAMTVGAIFAFSTYNYVKATPAAAPAKTTPVVVANSSLDLGAALRAEDLRTINWPSDDRPVGTFSNPQELVGRGLIQPVSQNEPLLPSKLAPVGAGIMQASASTAMMMLTPNRMRSQVAAVFFLIVTLIGSFSGPTLIAAITDYGFGDEGALRYSIASVAFAGLGAALVLLLFVRAAYRRSVDELAATEGL